MSILLKENVLEDGKKFYPLNEKTNMYHSDVPLILQILEREK